MNNNQTLTKAHDQWATRPADQRFKTIADLRASLDSRRMRSRSVDVALERSKVEIDASTGKLVVNSVITPSEPSHWAMRQFAGMLRMPGSYIASLPPKLAMDNLNHGLSLLPRESVKFMTTAPVEESLSTLQAVTSPTYGRIWDADVVDAVIRINERTGNKFYNPKAYCHKGDAKGFSTIDTSRPPEPSGLYASDRDVFVFMIDGGSLLDIGPRAQLNRGFMVWNSEVGARTLGMMTFLFNSVCGNHLIYGAQDVNEMLIRHTRNAPTRFDNEAAPQLMEYVNSSASKDEEMIRKAMNYRLPQEDEFDKFIGEFKFTKTEVTEGRRYAENEEGQCDSVWDLVQGLTAYARGFDYIDARIDLERRAGKLLKVVNN